MASTTVGAPPRPNALTLMRRSSAGPYLFIVALTIVMYFVLGPRQFVNALTIGAIYALVALGYTMVYGIIELINFAHGDVFMVGAFVSLFVLTNVLGQTGSATSLEQIVFVLAIDFAVTMTIVGVLGVTIERFAYRPLRNAPRLAP